MFIFYIFFFLFFDFLFELSELKHRGKLIMATLQEFIDQQTAFNASLDASVVGITADIDSLNAKIAALIAAGGAITPAQQVAIDALVAHGAALAAKVAALDALTPPVVPTA